MVTLGFFIIVSSPIWMVFVCVYAYAHRKAARRRICWAAAAIMALAWLLYGLPKTDGELFLVAPATFISILLVLLALHAMSTEASAEDAVLNVAEALDRSKGGEP